MAEKQPWKQFEVPEALVPEDVVLPTVQWINRASDVHELETDRGGFFVDDKNGIDLGWGRVTAFYRNDPGQYSDAMWIAPLAHRTVWEQGRGSSFSVTDGYVPGARRRMRILCLARMGDGFVGPVVLTTVGMANEGLEFVLRDHTLAAQRAGGQPFMFWLGLSAGKTAQFGKGDQTSQGTPILGSPAAADTLSGRYIGDGAIEAAVAAADLAERWKDKQSRGASGQDAPVFHPQTGEMDLPPAYAPQADEQDPPAPRPRDMPDSRAPGRPAPRPPADQAPKRTAPRAIKPAAPPLPVEHNYGRIYGWALEDCGLDRGGCQEIWRRRYPSGWQHIPDDDLQRAIAAVINDEPDKIPF